jgi:hypothetical protein
MRIVAEDNRARRFRPLNKRLTRVRKTFEMQTRRRLLLAVFVAALCVATLPSVSSAAPCWQRVITDWTTDGVINGHYSPHCLRQAYKNTPEDLRDYSGILDDINAALIGSGSNGSCGSGGNRAYGPNGSRSAEAKKRAAERAARAANLAVPGAGTKESDPGHDRSIPLPLIILGALAVLLALAALATWLARRIQTRRPAPAPAVSRRR